MDIESLYTADRHSSGCKMRVLDDLGKETDFYITLAGQDSDIWLEANRKRQNMLVSRALSKDKDEDDESEKELMGNLKLILDATLDWSGVDQEFSKEAALVLYQKAPYILDQCTAFIYNRANFTIS